VPNGSDALELKLLAIHDPGPDSDEKGEFNRDFMFMTNPRFKGGKYVHILMFHPVLECV
jgi:hypothetical protein